MKSRSASLACNLSVELTSCQHCVRNRQSSRNSSLRSRIRQKFLQKLRRNRDQKSRFTSCQTRTSGPHATAASPASSAKPTRSGGTTMRTSCPRRNSSRPTATPGSTSPRVP
ncbi:Uncharacterised protein [Mycobacteroides abscessus subsp. abscessus]|nr:Uncharacterised protein [Mycobacteroides abscessus subsp. abscessus]